MSNKVGRLLSRTHFTNGVGCWPGCGKPQGASRVECEAVRSAGWQDKLKEGVVGVLRRVANERVSAIVHEPDLAIFRNDKSIERRDMTRNGRYRQLRHPACRAINHAEPAWSNFGKPDASLRVMRHREDRRLRVRQAVERDVTSDGIEMTYGTACDIAEPDLSVQRHRQAEWSGGNAHARGWYRPGLDSASCRIKSPDAPTHCRRKPEKAPGIELERLRLHDAALHGAEREDAKCLPHRVKAPDVVGSLLNKPGVALRVYRGGHDAVLPIRGFPTRDHPG